MAMNGTSLYLLGSDGSTVVIREVLNGGPSSFRIGKLGSEGRFTISSFINYDWVPGFHIQMSGDCVPTDTSLSLPSACNETRNSSSQFNSPVSYLELGYGMDYFANDFTGADAIFNSPFSSSSAELEIICIPGLPRRFDYEELAVATENLKTQIGSGGFGTVYVF